MLTQWTTPVTGQTPIVMPSTQRVMQFRYPLPYGAISQEEGVQFVVYSHSATAMRVLLYRRVSDREPHRIVEFNPEKHGTIDELLAEGDSLMYERKNGKKDP